jgi:hypothetical protein
MPAIELSFLSMCICARVRSFNDNASTAEEMRTDSVICEGCETKRS